MSKLKGRVERFSVDNLQQREDFTSSFLRAWRIAATTHREEKLKALRNTVLNAAAGNAPDDDNQALFLSLIDAYTPWHLRILAFLADPEQWTSAHERGAFEELQRELRSVRGITFGSIVMCVFPDLQGRASLCARVERDLEFDDLVPRATGVRVLTAAVERLLNGVSLEGWDVEVLTGHGRAFLRIVSEPSSMSDPK